MGLINKPFRLNTIPLTEMKLREVLTKQQIQRVLSAMSNTLQGVSAMEIRIHAALHPKTDGKENSWYKIPNPAHNFYGINSIDLNRNVVNSLWIYCDIIDTSEVNNWLVPLLQLMLPSQHMTHPLHLKMLEWFGGNE